MPIVERAARAAVAVLTLLGLGGDPAAARTVLPTQAPPSWIAYAQIVSATVQARLDGDDPAAIRLRARLQQWPGAGGADGAVLKLALWIDRTGRITRIDHAPFAQPQPDDDLRSLVVGQTMSEAPPRGMLLPLRLSLRITPKPPKGMPIPASKLTTMTIRFHDPQRLDIQPLT